MTVLAAPWNASRGDVWAKMKGVGWVRTHLWRFRAWLEIQPVEPVRLWRGGGLAPTLLLATLAGMELDLNEVVSVLINTGLLTTVGAPVFLYYCFARLTGKISLNWYVFVPFAQAYMLTGFYFSVFGPRIVTTHLQTFLYLALGSHVLTTVLCLVVFFTAKPERPRRMFPMDLKLGALAIFGVHPFWMALGALPVLMSAITLKDDCDGARRCEAALLIAGHYGFTGTLFVSALPMGIAVIWLNFLCYIYLPYVPPEKNEKNE